MRATVPSSAVALLVQNSCEQPTCRKLCRSSHNFRFVQDKTHAPRKITSRPCQADSALKETLRRIYTARGSICHFQSFGEFSQGLRNVPTLPSATFQFISISQQISRLQTVRTRPRRLLASHVARPKQALALALHRQTTWPLELSLFSAAEAARCFASGVPLAPRFRYCRLTDKKAAAISSSSSSSSSPPFLQLQGLPLFWQATAAGAKLRKTIHKPRHFAILPVPLCS